MLKILEIMMKTEDINIFEINEKKYIVSGGNKGINVFNYPSFTNYNCFIEGNDNSYHNYAKIIRYNNIYKILDGVILI